MTRGARRALGIGWSGVIGRCATGGISVVASKSSVGVQSKGLIGAFLHRRYS